MADPKEVCEPVGSTTLFPVPFRLSPLNVGLNTSSVTELFELITVPDEKVAVPGVALVCSKTAPVVELTVPAAKLNSVVFAAFAFDVSVMSPEVLVTLLPASHIPHPFAFASVAEDPEIKMAPESEEITFVPVAAVPPQPKRIPMWFPVPVTPVDRAPSSEIEPEVVLMNEAFVVSMPVLCELVPIEAESCPRSRTSPAPAVIVPTNLMPE